MRKPQSSTSWSSPTCGTGLPCWGCLLLFFFALNLLSLPNLSYTTCTVLYCTVLHCTCHTPPDSWPHCPGCGWSGSCLPAACCRIVLSSAPGETTGIFFSDWKYNHETCIQSLYWWNTYYASSNPCVSFASSGCAPEINAEAEDNSSTPQLHETWKHIMVEICWFL